jgi:hypothetical protein
MWVWLNDEGKRVWGDVFPDGKVPVCSYFQEANLMRGGVTPIATRIVFVNWSALSSEQKLAVLTKISKTTGSSKVEILKDILKIGLPLRESYTTAFVAAKLRFFI